MNVKAPQMNSILPVSRPSGRPPEARAVKTGSSGSSPFADVLGQAPARSENSSEVRATSEGENARAQRVPGWEGREEPAPVPQPESAPTDRAALPEPVDPAEAQLQPRGVQEKAQQIESAQTRARGEADPLTRRVAMQSFMRKMREQLDIEPQRLVEAFSELDPLALVQPPEETVGLVIQNLQLAPEQVPVAQKLFEDMLRQTASSSMAEYLKSSGRELSLEVMSQRELRSRNLEESLARMNQNFFVDSRAIARQPKPAAGAGGQIMNDAAMKAYRQQAEGQKKGETLPFFAAAPSVASSAADSASVAASALSPESALNVPVSAWDANITPPSNAPAVPVDRVTTGFEPATGEAALEPMMVPELAFSESTAVTAPVAPEAGFDLSTWTPGFELEDTLEVTAEGEPMAVNVPNREIGSEAAPVATGFGGTGGEGLGRESTSQDQGRDPGPSEYYAANAAPTAKAADLRQAGAGFMMQGPKSNEADEAANVRELINQAQFMIKKGGGEMKVQLQPEGLGEVNLKVMVQDGQVRVEMVTDSHDAKKILEKGLADLKATLASHKLNVEGIRVDVGQQLSNELAQQQEQAQRHFAQQFLNEFRQENEAWRRNLWDTGGARRVASQIEDKAQGYGDSQLKKRASTRRLDLVA